MKKGFESIKVATPKNTGPGIFLEDHDFSSQPLRLFGRSFGKQHRVGRRRLRDALRGQTNRPPLKKAFLLFFRTWGLDDSEEGSAPREEESEEITGKL